MTGYTISIISDTVCPWCYVGRQRLGQAIAQHQAQHPRDTFAIRWAPFYLNPDAAAAPGVDKQAYYASRFGAGRTAVMQSQLARVGQAVGIAFAFGGRTGNTRDSHRVIALAGSKGPGVQDEVVRALFRAYFELEGDITSKDVLVESGVRGGLEREELREWLASGAGGEQVDREVGVAAQRWITGVPHFTINGQHEVHGAEEPAAFLSIFDAIKADSAGDASVVSGDADRC